MAKNKINRGGFLRMLSTMSIAPLVAKLPFVGAEKHLVEEAQLIQPVNPIRTPPNTRDGRSHGAYIAEWDYEPTETYQTHRIAGERIWVGDYVNISTDNRAYPVTLADACGIATNSSKKGRSVHILTHSHYSL